MTRKPRSRPAKPAAPTPVPRVLLAEDNATIRRILASRLQAAGFETVVVEDGSAALDILASVDAPTILVLDRILPGVSGLDICRAVRASARPSAYVIFITSMESPDEVVAGLEAGADDYLIKPFDPAELIARVSVGIRALERHRNLESRVHQLEDALTPSLTSDRALRLCAFCRRIRNELGSWQSIEEYLCRTSPHGMSHGICGDCYETEQVRHVELQK